MNIYQKLLEVRKAVPYLQKASSGHQYKYTGSSQVLSAVREKLDELGLLLVTKVVNKNVIPETVENTDKYNNNKKTTTYFTELELEFTWINAEKPEETIVVPFYAQGVDIAGEKGVGKALTYGEKYFILKQFNIATDQDDPDAFQKKVESTKPPKPMTDEQKEKIESGIEKLAAMRDTEKEKWLHALGVRSLEGVNYNQANYMVQKVEKWIQQAEKESA